MERLQRIEGPHPTQQAECVVYPSYANDGYSNLAEVE